VRAADEHAALSAANAAAAQRDSEAWERRARLAEAQLAAVSDRTMSADVVLPRSAADTPPRLGATLVSVTLKLATLAALVAAAAGVWLWRNAHLLLAHAPLTLARALAGLLVALALAVLLPSIVLITDVVRHLLGGAAALSAGGSQMAADAAPVLGLVSGVELLFIGAFCTYRCEVMLGDKWRELLLEGMHAHLPCLRATSTELRDDDDDANAAPRGTTPRRARDGAAATAPTLPPAASMTPSWGAPRVLDFGRAAIGRVAKPKQPRGHVFLDGSASASGGHDWAHV
jgi:hypothetical protein